MIEQLNGLIDFGIYFGVSIAILLVFKFLYAMITPHDEWKLVKEERSVAAAVAFGGAIIGFSIALSSAAKYSEGLLDFAIWGVVALVAQLIAFAIVRLLLLPKITERLEADETAAGVVVAAISIAVGLLNGACMSW